MATKRDGAGQAGKQSAGGGRGFLTLLVVVFIVGAAAIAYVMLKPKPVATTMVDANAPLPKAQGYVIGRDSAPVEITMYGDFECPGCGHFATVTEPDVITRLVNTGVARLRFVDSPIASHPATLEAHSAAACASEQGKFWEMHDRIYLNQNEWSTLANGRDMNAPKVMKRYAKELGLDTKAFDACYDSRKSLPQIRANAGEGVALGVKGTPSFRIGSRLVWAVLTYDQLKAYVDSALMDARKAAPPAKKGAADTSKKKQQ